MKEFMFVFRYPDLSDLELTQFKHSNTPPFIPLYTFGFYGNSHSIFDFFFFWLDNVCIFSLILVTLLPYYGTKRQCFPLPELYWQLLVKLAQNTKQHFSIETRTKKKYDSKLVYSTIYLYNCILRVVSGVVHRYIHVHGQPTTTTTSTRQSRTKKVHNFIGLMPFYWVIRV